MIKTLKRGVVLEYSRDTTYIFAIASSRMSVLIFTVVLLHFYRSFRNLRRVRGLVGVVCKVSDVREDNQ